MAPHSKLFRGNGPFSFFPTIGKQGKQNFAEIWRGPKCTYKCKNTEADFKRRVDNLLSCEMLSPVRLQVFAGRSLRWIDCQK